MYGWMLTYVCVFIMSTMLKLASSVLLYRRDVELHWRLSPRLLRQSCDLILQSVDCCVSQFLSETDPGHHTWITEAEKKGSSFTVHLPITKAHNRFEVVVVYECVLGMGLPSLT